MTGLTCLRDDGLQFGAGDALFRRLPLGQLLADQLLRHFEDSLVPRQVSGAVRHDQLEELHARPDQGAERDCDSG